jgi:pyrroline-5-carboxylate reductase
MSALPLPILVAGAGNLGGALITGWLRAGAIDPPQLMVRDPNPSPAALSAQAAGAALNPDDGALLGARTVILAVKPQIWRVVAADLAPRLGSESTIVSVVAGVNARDLGEAFGGRAVVRAMPTTAAAICQGATTLWSADLALRGRIATLFAPLGAVVTLEDEALIHVATAASGSGPAYLYAFIEALEAAAAGQGLEPADARNLVRATVTGAAALLAQSGEDPAELRRKVTSPKGVTEAALAVLMGPGGFEDLLNAALAKAVARSRELGA